MKPNRRFKCRPQSLVVTLLIVAGLLLAACGTPQPQTVTIGVVNLSLALNPVFDGFKAGMADLGYVEGQSVTYIYAGPVGSIEALEPAIQDLKTQDIDLLLALSTPATLQAKHAVKGTDIPVVFAPVNDPVGSGVVDNLRNPGGNLTGIQVGGFVPKELEWLLTIAPDTTHLFVPYNPDDSSAVQGMVALDEAADKLGIEIVVGEAHTPDEIMSAIDTIPEEVDAIFLPPDNLMTAHIDDFVAVALERDIPISSVAYPQAEAGALMSYGPDFFRLGEQVARLADKVLQGTSPADLPIETAEFFLSINLQTAEAIGLDIPDTVLRQADNIIR